MAYRGRMVGKRELKKQKDNIAKMEEQIKDNKKIDKEYTQKIYGKLLENTIIAVVIMAVIYIANILIMHIPVTAFELTLKISALVALAITILVFEIAYRKDNDTIAIHGIEFLFCSIVIGLLYIPYRQCEVYQFRRILTMCTTLVGLYYLVKSLVIVLKMQKKYFKEKNDISEIIKK